MHCWQDEGLVLEQRRFGEDQSVVSIFTRMHGRTRGLVRESLRSSMPVGAEVSVGWRARLEEQLGVWRLEESRTTPLAFIFRSPLALQGLSLLCTMLRDCVPERFPSPPLYEATLRMVHALALNTPLSCYAYFEGILLSELGCGTPDVHLFLQNPFPNTDPAEMILTHLRDWSAIFSGQWPSHRFLALRRHFLTRLAS